MLKNYVRVRWRDFTEYPTRRRKMTKTQVPKIETNIVGLDEILNGGLPKGELTIVSGGPGTGKTMLGLEFLLRGAQAGNAGIILTFEEREQDLRNYARGFGWDTAKYEEENKLAIISARLNTDALISGEFDLRGIFNILIQKAKKINAKRVVVDGPDVFLRLLDNISKEKSELHNLHEKLRDSGLTTILSVKDYTNFNQNYEFLEYMATCVISLDQRVYEQISTRRLRVIKYRGNSFSRNEYPFSITDRGIWIIPVTRASLKHHAFGETLHTGIEGLDRILGGGFRRYSCNLISGSSGTGKTTFVSSFVISATTKGQKVLYIDFEESWDALSSCMLSPGIDLQSAQDSGKLLFISSMPESKGIEEHLIEAFRAIEDFNPKHLIVDAISACDRMGTTHAAFDYLLRLINHCKTRGITTLLTNLTSQPDARNEITGIDLSSLIDTVILLRNLEKDGNYIRELGILKSRGRHHSSKIHEFHITDNGIKFDIKES